METPEFSADLVRLVEIEARLDLHRLRRRGVLMRFFFLFLPLSILTLWGMELGFSLPITVLLAAASLCDHFIHHGRFRASERERPRLLAERNG
jgi:hypothetical protein